MSERKVLYIVINVITIYVLLKLKVLMKILIRNGKTKENWQYSVQVSKESYHW